MLVPSASTFVVSFCKALEGKCQPFQEFTLVLKLENGKLTIQFMMSPGCKIWHCCIDNKWATNFADPCDFCGSSCIQMSFKINLVHNFPAVVLNYTLHIAVTSAFYNSTRVSTVFAQISLALETKMLHPQIPIK